MLAILLTLFLWQQSSVSADDLSGIRVAYVKDDELYVGILQGESRRLTNDKLAKSLPVWSKNGSKIAFIRDVDAKRALATLVVVTAEGRETSSIDIKPTASSPQPQLMRFVESVAWISDDRVLVAGSVIPQLSEIELFDINTGKIVREDQVQDPGIFYSPDGRHYAYETGQPHFSSRSSDDPALRIDDKQVYPQLNTSVDFRTLPRWSADSERLAIVARERESAEVRLLIWGNGEEAASVSLGRREASCMDLFWDSNSVIVEGNGAELWWTKKTGLSTNNPQTNPFAKGLKLVDRLNVVTEERGFSARDYWCESCPLAALPQANPIASSVSPMP